MKLRGVRIDPNKLRTGEDFHDVVCDVLFKDENDEEQVITTVRVAMPQDVKEAFDSAEIYEEKVTDAVLRMFLTRVFIAFRPTKEQIC